MGKVWKPRHLLKEKILSNTPEPLTQNTQNPQNRGFEGFELPSLAYSAKKNILESDPVVRPPSGEIPKDGSKLITQNPQKVERSPWDDLLTNLEAIHQELETRGYPLVRVRWFANDLEVLATAKRVRTLNELEQTILEAYSMANSDTDHASLLTRADNGQDVVLAGFSKAAWTALCQARRKVVTA